MSASSTGSQGRLARRALVAVAVLGAGAAALIWSQRAKDADSSMESGGRAAYRVEKILRSASQADSGASLVLASGAETPLLVQGVVGEGASVRTDARTRVRLASTLGEGTRSLVLDRASECTLQHDALSLRSGTVQLEDRSGAAYAVLADTARVDGVQGRITVTRAAGGTIVAVQSGEAQVSTAEGRVRESLRAGQEAIVTAAGIEVALATALRSDGEHSERDREGSGLGELRAKKPGAADTQARALRVAKHDVRARIAGGFARTEIEEVFANDTDDVLEGIYRFRLPRGATIERLALDVDGTLIEGEFLDKARADKIWKGVIWNATPKRPKPKDDIVWVPGPWRDPALLDWSDDGVFTLRIFPIPKQGSRRVVIAYTERLLESRGQREYRYPLPEDGAASLGEFSLDLQVRGHDRSRGAQAEGYGLVAKAVGEDAESFGMQRSNFRPDGDVVLRFALPEENATVRAYGYEDDAGKRFVALALKPNVPAFGESKPRDVVLLVDSSRSMYGARFEEARRLVREVAESLDRRDRVTVMACDLWCRRRQGGWSTPGVPASAELDAYLASITPDGVSDVEGALLEAAAQPAEAGRERVVVVISSGASLLDASGGARLGQTLRAREDLHVVMAPVGSAPGQRQLGRIAEAAGGVGLRAEPDVRSAAQQVLRAMAGSTLRRAELVLPEGLSQQTPQRLPVMLAGDELMVVTHADRARIDGELALKGYVAGEFWERRVPLRVDTVKGQANAFVPRLFASSRTDELWSSARPAHRQELVALSTRWHVPSPHTSLLVLESEAMFKAFGIERSDHAVGWTGDDATQATLASADVAEDEEAVMDAFGGGGMADSASSIGRAAAPSGPMALGAPAPAASASRPKSSLESSFDDRGSEKRAESMPRPSMPSPGRTVPMRRTWVRSSTISMPEGLAVTPSVLADARRALADKPDAPARHAKLARLLLAAGPSYESELDAIVAAWQSKDPLDADLLDLRADRLAARGDRQEALRVRSGVWSSPVDDAARVVLLDTLAAAVEPADACRFQMAIARRLPTDHARAARALGCVGDHDVREELRASLQDAGLAPGALVVVKQAAPARGDFVAKASWDGGAVDLDLVLVGPDGRRYDLTARDKGVNVLDARAIGRETLTAKTRGQGSFSLRAVRVSGDGPVQGRVELAAPGSVKKQLAFALAGHETEIARIAVATRAVLVPAW